MNHLSNDQLNLLLDEQLDPVERTRAQAHLDECAACRAELAALERVVHLLDAVVDEPLPTDLTPAVLAKLVTVRSVVWPHLVLAAQILTASALSIWLAPSLLGELAIANAIVSESNLFVDGFGALVTELSQALDALDFVVFQNIAPLEWGIVAAFAFAAWLFANRILIVNLERRMI